MQKLLKINSIDIDNFRSISNIKNLRLKGDLIPIVGLNGAGKSNILKAIHWFSIDSNIIIDKDKEDKLENIYLKNRKTETKVSFSFALKGTENGVETNRSLLEDAIKKIFDDFIETFNSENIDSKSSYYKEVSEMKDSILNKNKIKIVKMYNPQKYTKSFYSFDVPFALSNIKSDDDILEVNSLISNLIENNILKKILPKIHLLDTKETLKEFSDDNKTGKPLSKSFSFKRMFEWTNYENKDEAKYKIISKILEKTGKGYTFDEWIRISISANKQNISILEEDNSKELLELQNNFSKSITSNSFFRSINSDNEFIIFPEYKPISANVDNGTLSNESYKLTLFDTVKYEDGETKKFAVKNIGFKNDGFIFALILFMEIDFLIENGSILLIDEPANFLSSTSVKLLMENFMKNAKEKGNKFIFTTHSSQTLDKNLVEIENIIIAKKTPDFCTITRNFQDNDVKYENEIISREYSNETLGKDLIMYDKEKSIKKVNYLVKARTSLENDFIEYITYLTNKNIIPLYDVKLVKRNNRKFYNDNGYDLKEVGNFPKISDIINNDDIENIIGEYELTPDGAINKFKLNNDLEYKMKLVEKIFSAFNRDFKLLEDKFKKTNKLIKESVEKLN